MDLKLGDILLVKAHLSDILGDAIRLGELIRDGDGDYKHVAIYIGNDTVAEAPGNRPTGETSLSLYTGMYDIGRIDLADSQREAVVAEARKEFGKPYDWKYIEEIGLHILLGLDEPTETDKTKLICTTYVMSVFKNALGIDFDCGVTPVELSKSSRITLVKI